MQLITCAHIFINHSPVQNNHINRRGSVGLAVRRNFPKFVIG